MNKLKMHSPDLTQDNISRLHTLFPGCVTEAQDARGNIKRVVDFDLLRQELSDSLVEGPQERYQLNWPGKKEALLLANTPIAKTLRPCPEESVDFANTKNLFIEGDNLDALKLLQETYLGKVKMIYIDPPYNTGNDFIYKDDFSDSVDEYLKKSNQKDESNQRLVANTESNGRFHSDWMSMIYPRLKLSRNLLKEDGVIFISIDDGEVANLRAVADQVFGEKNFIANIVWQKKYTRSNDAKWFSDNHDHILCYGKNKLITTLNLLPRNEEQLASYSNPDLDPNGVWKATPLHAKSGTNASEYVFKNGVRWKPPIGTYRRFNDDTMSKMERNNEIWFGENGNQTPSRKSFLSQVKDGVTPVTLWPYDEVGHNHEANNELKKLGVGGLFQNPKPTRLIKRSLLLTSNEGDIIIDFFSGSGTTADAMFQLNSEDGKNRAFILVQLPELCAEKSEAKSAGFNTTPEITKERIRRSGHKILEGYCHPNWNKDIGFRVLKIDSSNMADIYYTPDNTSQGQLELLVDNIKPDRTADDLLFQVMLDCGIDLASKINKKTIHNKDVFFVDEESLVACFDATESVDDDFVRLLAAHKPQRVVFRETGFKDSASKINVEQIFKSLSPSTLVKCI